MFSLNPGNGLTGGVTDDPIGNGVSASIAVLPGPGIVSAPGGVSVKVDTDTIGFNESGELMALGAGGTGYGNHTVVALSGGDYLDPVAAMADRASWCGVPSSTNPCLMKIMPGVYNLNAALPLISYIDIEGSGRNITVLVRNSTGFTGGIITASGQCGNQTCEVRDLSLRADGSGSGTSGTYVVRISNSRLQSIDNATVIQGRANFSIFAYYSRLAGLTPSFTTCASVVDTNYVHYSNTCPP